MFNNGMDGLQCEVQCGGVTIRSCVNVSGAPETTWSTALTDSARPEERARADWVASQVAGVVGHGCRM